MEISCGNNDEGRDEIPFKVNVIPVLQLNYNMSYCQIFSFFHNINATQLMKFMLVKYQKTSNENPEQRRITYTQIKGYIVNHTYPALTVNQLQ